MIPKTNYIPLAVVADPDAEHVRLDQEVRAELARLKRSSALMNRWFKEHWETTCNWWDAPGASKQEIIENLRLIKTPRKQEELINAQ